MASQILIGAQLAHILLVLGLYVVLARRKIAAVRAGDVDRQAAALDNRKWPDVVVQVSNCIANQFEAPVLFHVLALMTLVLQLASPALAGLALVFIVSRYAHAYVHTSSNHVPHRFRLFAVGMLSILLMWALLLVMWLQRLTLTVA